MPRGRSERTESRPTREDVAKLAKTSGTTVSRVLSGREFQISPEVRSRVLKAARELGYSPNAAATALRSGRSGMIGFWMCLGYSRYRSQVADQMQRILSDEGLAMAVTDADHEYIFEHSISRAMRLPVDGIIAFDAFAAAGAFTELHNGLPPNIPFVSMGAYWSPAYSYVGIDLKAGAEMATDHFISLGRRRLAYLAPWNSGLLTDGPRYEGFRDRAMEAGLEPKTIAVESSTVDSLEESFRELQSSGNLPDAIFFVNDDLAMDAVPALERMGLCAGRDVALVGFNGTEGTERGGVPISTVRQPIEEMCHLAFQFLQAQWDDPKSPVQQKLLKPELIVRASSGV